MTLTLPQYVGSIDQGTSSTRFILFDQNGNIVRSAQIELKQIHVDGKPGWAEHDPLEIIESVEWCINKVLTDHPPILASQVLSIGITNQRETTVAWDRITGKPLHNALVWHDTRTRELVDEMIQRYPQLGVDHFRASAGLPLSTYFSALKMKWLIMNVPSVEEALNANRCLFGTIDSWLIWNLSGGAIHPDRARHVTDVSNASRTMLMNLKTLKWDQQNCDEFSIPMSILPTILSNSEVYAPVAVGPLAGVPIAGCIGDQQSAMLGQLCFSVGSAKATYGTGCFMLLNTGNQPIQSNHGLLTTVCFQLGPKKDCIFALEGSVAVAGSGVRWLRDEMKLISKASEIDELASAVPDSNDVYMVPAFSGLLSPYWRSDARGVITGLTHSSSRHHLARAVLDAAAYQTGDVLHSMESDTRDKGIKLSLLKVDGGMCASNLLMQFQSDLLQIPVHRPFSLEATASGAAFAAGLATGFWKDERDLIEKVSTHPNTRIFQPLMSIERRDELYRGWKKSVERTFGWIQPNHTPISSTSSPSSPSSTILSTSTSLPSSTPTPPPTLSSQFRKLSSTRFLSHFALFSIGIMVGLGINSIRKKH